jgi:NAD(P)-dependent dehydrogenase (short-subunit alcohol dehydrogenase family)
VLVNNAGIAHAAEFLELTEEDFDRVLRVNLKGAFLCGQAAARRMAAQPARADARIPGERGVVINMSSANAVVAIANQVPYTVSKGGMNQLTKVMAIALAPKGIRVMGIGPGSIATELLKTAVLSNEAAKTRILSRTPLGRLGEPDEVAGIAVFLASDEASYLTGSTVYPDGGRLALNYTM